MLPFRKSNSRVCFLYTLIIAHFFDFVNLLFAFFQKNFEQARTAKRGELVRCGTKPRVLVFRTCRKPTGNLPEPNTRHKTLPGFKACSIRGIRDLTACCARCWLAHPTASLWCPGLAAPRTLRIHLPARVLRPGGTRPGPTEAERRPALDGRHWRPAPFSGSSPVHEKRTPCRLFVNRCTPPF